MTEPSEEEIWEVAESIETGDEVLVNDRSRPLEAVDRFTTESRKTYRSDSITVVLEGNGTMYHLLWSEDHGVLPMLYKESDWEVTEDAYGEEKYEYPRMGDRVRNLEFA